MAKLLLQRTFQQQFVQLISVVCAVFSVNYYLIISLTLLISTTQLSLTLATIHGIQTIQLKSSTSKLEEIQSNVRDLANVSKLLAAGENIDRMCPKPLSVWIVYHLINYSEPDGYPLYGILNFTGDTRKDCGLGYPQMKSFRHVGNLNTRISSLSLFKSSSFQGLELYFTGTILQLPQAIQVWSFGFTGKDSWELFEVGFGNLTHCLKRPTWADQKYPWLDNNETFKLPVYINRVARGCNNNSPRIRGAAAVAETADTDITSSPAVAAATSQLPSLRLFTDPHIKERSLFMQGKELRLPVSHKFTSSLLESGKSAAGWNNTWQIYSGRDFDGDSRCLNTTATTFSSKIEVGSIKFGCGHPVNKLLEEITYGEPQDESQSSGVMPNLSTLLPEATASGNFLAFFPATAVVVLSSSVMANVMF